MKIQINIGEADNAPALRELAEAEVEKALARFADRVTRVELHLRDLNGPAGGLDQRCSIEVRLAGYDPLAVDAEAVEAAAAIRDAAGKARRAVERKVDRRESFR